MEHENYREKIEKYLAGDLSVKEETGLFKHLDQCEKCRAEFEEAQSFEKIISSTLRATGESLKKPSLKRSLAEDLARTRKKRNRLSRVRNWAFIFTVMAVVLMALAMFLARTASISAKIAETRETVQSISTEIRNLNPRDPDKITLEKISEIFKTEGKSPSRDSLRLSEKDAWNNGIIVQKTSDRIIIYSIGPDGVDHMGYEDDIVISILYESENR